MGAAQVNLIQVILNSRGEEIAQHFDSELVDCTVTGDVEILDCYDYDGTHNPGAELLIGDEVYMSETGNVYMVL